MSLAPTIGLGIGRFAYALVLPDMRDALGWSYSAAGFMNTINAVGYLAGALLASRMIRRFGLARTVRWGTLAAVTSLALCAVSGNFFVLSFARLLAGIGAAGGFVGGAALAATIAQTRPERANFLLSLFYAGPGLGILASGLIAPFVLQGFGPGSWWIVWWAMTLLSAVMILPLLLAPLGGGADIDSAAPARFSIRPVLAYLIGYFLFGAGYIAYMTFMIAYVRDGGGGAAAQSLFWSLIGRQRVRDALGMAPGAGAGSRRPCHRNHPRRQRDRRGVADLRALAAVAGDLGAGVRRRVLRGGGIDHRLRALQLSAIGLADGDRGDDDFVRHRPDAGADRGRRDHRRGGQSFVCAQRLGGDAGDGRGVVCVSEAVEDRLP